MAIRLLCYQLRSHWCCSRIWY